MGSLVDHRIPEAGMDLWRSLGTRMVNKKKLHSFHTVYLESEYAEFLMIFVSNKSISC